MVDVFSACAHSLKGISEKVGTTSIYLLHESLSNDSISRVKDMFSGLTVNLIDVSFLWFFEPIPGENDRLTRAAYFRLLIPRIFSDIAQYVYYFDVDLIFLPGSEEIFRHEFDGAICASDHFTPQEAARLGISANGYFNSGVLVFNLGQVDTQEFENSVIKIMKFSSHLIKWCDQDVLNLVYAKRWSELPPEFNTTIFVRRHFRGTSSFRPRIIHFAGSTKPWHSHYSRGRWVWQREYMRANGHFHSSCFRAFTPVNAWRYIEMKLGFMSKKKI